MNDTDLSVTANDIRPLPAATLFPENDICLVTSNIKNSFDEIYPEESEFIRNAAQKRINEFSTGRLCAKKALSHFGINQFPVLIGEHREPVWPKSIIGSISHCKDIVAVAVARKGEYKSLGIDIESVKELRYDLRRHVCTDDENRWIASRDSCQNDILQILLFSLKESVYKAFFQYAKVKMRFNDCSIIPDLNNNTAEITFSDRLTANITHNILCLRFYIEDKHIFSSAIIK